MMANHKTDVITHGKQRFQNTRKPKAYFHKILFNLCIVWPKTIKWTNVCFFCGITFKIRSKLPLLLLLEHTQLWYTHGWLASSAQVTSLLQRMLLSQHKTNITYQHSCPQQGLDKQFQNWEAANLCLRQHSHQDWHKCVLVLTNWFQKFN